MKFNGRNDGLAMAVRNHIMLFRSFIITLFILLVPTIIFVCKSNPYFWIFLILPLIPLVMSFIVFLFIKYDEHVFLGNEKKNHLFEIKNDSVYKDGKEIKLIRSVKIYHYKNFLYMETSHSMFIIKNTDFISGDREGLLNWAKIHNIRILFGY